MLLFLIPVLVLVGATSIGIAAEIAQSNAPPSPANVQTESRPAPPPSPPQKRLP
jgi:hypothetical protein